MYVALEQTFQVLKNLSVYPVAKTSESGEPSVHTLVWGLSRVVVGRSITL
jgi:hypothetical protein